MTLLIKYQQYKKKWIPGKGNWKILRRSEGNGVGTEEKKRVYTIEDIARELGVSKTTVSRAISGKGRISAKTRAKVLDFIQEHNYRPNAVAKSLAHSCTYNLGLILPADFRSMDISFFKECIFGICEVAAQNDYDVLITLDNGQYTGQMERILDNPKVDGVIAARSEVNSPVAALLKERGIPFVIMGFTSDPEILHVDNNNREACRELTQLLISRGMRRLALLGGDENYCVTHSRFQGFKDACQQSGLSWQEQQVFMNMVDSTRVAAAIRELADKQVDCILCMDDFICNLAMIQLREQKIRIPQDVKIACFYDNSLLEHTVPSVTSLRFDSVELGKTACQTLLDLLAGKEAKSSILPGYRIILRDSTE